MQGFSEIAGWAGFHHEKAEGNGYPFRLTEKELSLGAKIMAVADVFSALAEIRPYREGLPKEKVISIMKEDAQSNRLPYEIVELLFAHYEQVDLARDFSAKKEDAEYYEMIQQKDK